VIILDTNSLVRWIVADPDEDDAARFKALLENAKEAGVGIGVPAPAFAEFLVRTDEATTEVLSAVERRRGFRVLPFDKRAAHECALLDRAALVTGKKGDAKTQPWQKIKIDRQILAIARVNGAQLLITADKTLTTMANSLGLSVKTIPELPIPDEARQRPLFTKAGQESGGEADDES